MFYYERKEKSFKKDLYSIFLREVSFISFQDMFYASSGLINHLSHYSKCIVASDLDSESIASNDKQDIEFLCEVISSPSRENMLCIYSTTYLGNVTAK